jgi:hypothetical protein
LINLLRASAPLGGRISPKFRIAGRAVGPSDIAALAFLVRLSKLTDRSWLDIR